MGAFSQHCWRYFAHISSPVFQNSPLNSALLTGKEIPDVQYKMKVYYTYKRKYCLVPRSLTNSKNCHNFLLSFPWILPVSQLKLYIAHGASCISMLSMKKQQHSLKRLFSSFIVNQ
jgi:hypothetical protein